VVFLIAAFISQVSEAVLLTCQIPTL
jgi:hypothetical protein